MKLKIITQSKLQIIRCIKELLVLFIGPKHKNQPVHPLAHTLTKETHGIGSSLFFSSEKHQELKRFSFKTPKKSSCCKHLSMSCLS